MDPSNPEFDATVNDALYGIQINGESRLVYDKDYGLDLVSLQDIVKNTDNYMEKAD